MFLLFPHNNNYYDEQSLNIKLHNSYSYFQNTESCIIMYYSNIGTKTNVLI